MTKIWFVILALLFVGCGGTYGNSTSAQTATSGRATGGDPCQPNYCVLNPNVTQATISSTICVWGWTATVRPPVSYTDALKAQQMQSEGFSNPANYEEDHRLPLELGGAPSDPHNLSPEQHPNSSSKDQDENYYKSQVCSGVMILYNAQVALIQKWLAPWPKYKL